MRKGTKALSWKSEITFLGRKYYMRACLLTGLATVCAFMLAAGPASAAGAEGSISVLAPDDIAAGHFINLEPVVENEGPGFLSGTMTITDTFPVGIIPADPLTIFTPEKNPYSGEERAASCEVQGQADVCTVDVDGMGPGAEIRLKYRLAVEAGASGTLVNRIDAEAGGMDPVVAEQAMTVGPPGPFEVNKFDMDVESAPNVPASAAGSTPTEIRNVLGLRGTVGSMYEFPFVVFSAPTEHLKDIEVSAPAGIVGNPNVVPIKCTAVELVEPSPLGNAESSSCPQDSQIGLVRVYVSIFGPEMASLYAMEPRPGVPAEFGLRFQGVTVGLVAKLRPSDYGVDLVSRGTPATLPFKGVDAMLWGVPSDESHAWLRNLCNESFKGNINNLPCPSEAPRKSFLRMPTSCLGGPLSWGADLNTWEHPATNIHVETKTPALDENSCNVVPFDPALSVAPSEPKPSEPSGFEVDLSLPQESNPDGIAESDLKEATVTLPEGVVVNPGSADGLAACSDAQLRLGLDGPSECPDASKIGSLELKSPLLDHSLDGSVFLRSQASSDPASGDLYRLAIEVRSDEDGIAIKLPGSLKADPQTGQLTTTFKDLPQLPFESMKLRLKSGGRAPLTMPKACGRYTTQAELHPWARPEETVPLYSSFTIDQNCTTPGFSPGFEAGTERSTAGAFSPFSLRVTRGSGEPNLSRIDATLPEGELAKLAGVPRCPDAAAATGACPVASRIGQVVAGIGEGSSPLYLPQPGKSPTSVYLAGPYKGAPYSVVAAVPAQAGPFDLGTVSVRSALQVDHETTRASVLSDPLPQIYGGIPVSYRDVRVQVDRPEFTVNPTDCEPQAVDGSITPTEGGAVAVSSRFQMTDCAALGFKPKLSLHLRGKTRRAGNPALTAVLQMPKHGANIARTAVSLPHSEFVAQSHLQNVCTRVQYNAGAGGGSGCPKNSVYGRARAFSPLLDYPLEGPVYLRSNGGDRSLPDLVASLGGEIHVDLVGYIDTDKKTGGLRTTFAKVPDAPVSKFVLKMGGGRKSLLENSTNICRGNHSAIVRFDGQNGRTHDFRAALQAQCGKSRR